MGFFLTDAIQSAFTRPGTNDRNDQVQRQTGLANQAGQMADMAGQNYLGAMKYAQSLDPQIQGVLSMLAKSASGSGLMDQAIAGGNRAKAQAMSQGIPLMAQNNPALAQAMQLMNLNKAQDATNQNIFAALDPQKKQQMLLMLMQALGQYKNSAGNDFSRAASTVYGQPQVQVGGGLMDMIAPFLGNMYGQQSVGKGGNGNKVVQ